MPAKTVPVSVRLSQQEADFINKLHIGDAETPSEKLRAIIRSAEQRQLGTEDYPSALQLAQESLLPTLDIVKASEHTYDVHSQLIGRVGPWLADCMAFLTACNGQRTELDEQALQLIEKALLDRVALLMQSVLQLGITRHGPLYDAENYAKSMRPVLELAALVGAQQGVHEVE